MFAYNITGLVVAGVLALIAYEWQDNLGWWYVWPVLAGILAFFIIRPWVQKKVDAFMADVRAKAEEMNKNGKG